MPMKKGGRAAAARGRKGTAKRGGPFGRTSLTKIRTAIQDTERQIRRFKPEPGREADKEAALKFLEDLLERVRVACVPAKGLKAAVQWFGGVLGPHK